MSIFKNKKLEQLQQDLQALKGENVVLKSQLESAIQASNINLEKGIRIDGDKIGLLSNQLFNWWGYENFRISFLQNDLGIANWNMYQFYLLVLNRVRTLKNQFQINTDTAQDLVLFNKILEFTIFNGNCCLLIENNQIPKLYRYQVLEENALYIEKALLWECSINNGVVEQKQSHLVYDFSNTEYQGFFLTLNTAGLGIWALTFFYLMKALDYLNIIDNNMFLLTKKIIKKMSVNDANMKNIYDLQWKNTESLILGVIDEMDKETGLFSNNDTPINILDTKDNPVTTAWESLNRYLDFWDFEALGLFTGSSKPAENGARNIASETSQQQFSYIAGSNEFFNNLTIFLKQVQSNTDFFDTLTFDYIADKEGEINDKNTNDNG